jgi:hypothetical protein
MPIIHAELQKLYMFLQVLDKSQKSSLLKFEDNKAASTTVVIFNWVELNRCFFSSGEINHVHMVEYYVNISP